MCLTEFDKKKYADSLYESGRTDGMELQKKLDSELIASKEKALASKDREIAELLAKIDYYEKLEIKN